MGFRTANLVVPDQMRPLGDGVYAAYAHVDGVRYKAAVNVGVAATFADRATATCSVFDEENTQVVDAFLASPEGAGFTVAPLSESQILQLPDFAQAKKLVAVRQNDRGFFQSVPINADSYDGHFCARLVHK